MEGLKEFLKDYWDFARWYLLALGLLYLVMTLWFRRGGRATALLLIGVYVTITAYFLKVRESLGFSPEMALAVVIVSGLVFLAIVYYFVFIRWH